LGKEVGKGEGEVSKGDIAEGGGVAVLHKEGLCEDREKGGPWGGGGILVIFGGELVGCCLGRESEDFQRRTIEPAVISKVFRGDMDKMAPRRSLGMFELLTY